MNRNSVGGLSQLRIQHKDYTWVSRPSEAIKWSGHIGVLMVIIRQIKENTASQNETCKKLLIYFHFIAVMHVCMSV